MYEENIGSEMTTLVADLLECDDCGIPEQFKEEKIKNIKIEFGEESGTDHWPCDSCGGEGDSDEIDCHTALCKPCYDSAEGYNKKDIYEWWGVTPFLGEALIKENEAVLKNDYGYFWGRPTKAPIFQDRAIKKIFKEVKKNG